MIGRSRRQALATLVAALVTVVAGGCSGADLAESGDVFRVEIESCAGTSKQRATAMAVSATMVATAAHTFEDARTVVLRDRDGNEQASDVLYLDPERDVALLSVGLVDHVFELAAADDDIAVRIPTYADVDGIVVKDATVARTVTATLDGEGRRQALELLASIERGDSGSPVVDEDGRAVGMVFAASRRADRGWALAAAELDDAMAALSAGTTAAPISPCQSP